MLYSFEILAREIQELVQWERFHTRSCKSEQTDTKTCNADSNSYKFVVEMTRGCQGGKRARNAPWSFYQKTPWIFRTARTGPIVYSQIETAESLTLARATGRRSNGGGGGASDVVVLGFIRSWFPSSQRQERAALVVARSISAGPHGVRATGLLRLPVGATAEGAQMDLLEQSESRKEILLLR